MTITSLSISAALRGKLESRLFHPDDPERTPEQGLELLRRVALDAPVHIVTLERGWPAHELRRVRHDELRPAGLLAGKTAYAAALEIEGRACLILVAVSPLCRPAQAPRFWPHVSHDEWNRYRPRGGPR